MTDNRRDQSPELEKLDTLRPPGGSDAYSAETVVRQAPPELIAQARAALQAARVPRPGEAPRPAARPAAPAKPDARSASGTYRAANDPLPVIEDAESGDGDNVETQLWRSGEHQAVVVPEEASPGDADAPSFRAAPVDAPLVPLADADESTTSPITVALVLFLALLVGAFLAYYLSGRPL
jgi:hypothetical protein